MASRGGPGGPGARGMSNSRFAQFKLVLLGAFLYDRLSSDTTNPLPLQESLPSAR